MQRTTRLPAIILALAPAALLALTVARPAQSRLGSPRPADTTRGEIHSVAADGPVVVRTVSAPGMMSTGMRAALASVGALDARSDRDVRSQRLPDGTLMVFARTRFLHFYVGGVDADGVASGRCVSSMDALIRYASADRASTAGAEKE